MGACNSTSTFKNSKVLRTSNIKESFSNDTTEHQFQFNKIKNKSLHLLYYLIVNNDKLKQIKNKKLFKVILKNCVDCTIVERTLNEHTDNVYCLIRLNATQIASASDNDGNIIIWDITNGNCVRKIINDGFELMSSLLKLSENTLACGSSNGFIKIWDFKKGECLMTLRDKINKSNLNDFCALIKFNEVQLFSFNADGGFYKWDLNYQNFTDIIRHFDEIIYLIKLNSSQIAYIGSHNKIRIYDLIEKEELLKISDDRGPDTYLQTLVKLNDDLLACGSNYSIKVWNYRNGKQVKALTNGNEELKINCITKLSKNKIASGGFTGYIKVWDFYSCECLLTISVNPNPNSLSLDGINCSINDIIKLNEYTVVCANGNHLVKIINLV